MSTTTYYSMFKFDTFRWYIEGNTNWNKNGLLCFPNNSRLLHFLLKFSIAFGFNK